MVAAMRTFLLGAVLALAALGGCKTDKDKSAAGSAAKADDLPTMTVAEVDQAIAAKQAQAIDCNGERTRKKLGVVPGAILISDEEEYPASELPADKTTKLIFYCADPG
jgi:uncharacterized small protein (DUF1192 family)